MRKLKSARRTALMEALESRILLSTDLEPTNIRFAGPDVLVPGDKATITIDVKNIADEVAKGTVNLTVRASTDHVYSDGDTLLGVISNKSVNLGTNKKATFTLPFAIPANLVPGSYYAVVKLTSVLTIPDTQVADDVDRSITTRGVEWAFGAVGSRKNVKLALNDGTGPVTFALSGPGTGMVTQGTGSFATNAVQLEGTTTASAMSITTGKGLYTTLDSIDAFTMMGPATGALKSISAPTTNIATEVTLPGLISSVTLHDATGAYFGFNTDSGTMSSSANVSIIAHTLDGCEVDTGGVPLKSLKAAQVTNLTLTAPSAGTINVSSKVPGEGNLSGTLTFSGEPASNLSLSTLTVSGSLDGTNVTAEVDIGTIQAAQWNTGSVSVSSLKKLQIAQNMGATVSAPGLSSATIGGNLTGNWSVLYLGSLSVKGDLVGATIILPGTIFGTPLASYDNHCNSIAVGGWIENSTVQTAFPIGSVTAGGIEDSNLMLGVSGTTLPTSASDFQSNHAGRFTSVTIKGFKDASKAPIVSFINSNIVAWQIKSISIAYVESDNSGTAFGIAAHSIGKLTYKHLDGTTDTVSGLDTADESVEVNDFRVSIV